MWKPFINFKWWLNFNNVDVNSYFYLLQVRRGVQMYELWSWNGPGGIFSDRFNTALRADQHKQGLQVNPGITYLGPKDLFDNPEFSGTPGTLQGTWDPFRAPTNPLGTTRTKWEHSHFIQFQFIPNLKLGSSESVFNFTCTETVTNRYLKR